MIAVMFLFLLTILGMSMHFMSNSDLKISRNVYRGTRSFYAAEAGISETIGRLNLSPGDALYDAAMFPATFVAGWEYTFENTLDNGDSYTVIITHKQDESDLDGDLDTDEIVTYDKGFFSTIDYPAVGEGYAVEKIRSTGISADGEVVVVLEITKLPLDIMVKGAVTANSDVHVQGNFEANGLNHDMDGNLVGSGDMPGVITTVGNETTTQGSADIYGDPPFTGTPEAGTWDETNPDFGPYPNSPEEVLGLTGSMANDFLDPANVDYYGPYDGSIGMNSGDPLTGITYITGDYPGPKENGSGILIIHNPNFDPCEYESSKKFVDTGFKDACWNAAWDDPDYLWTDATHTTYLGYYHERGEHQPAKLGNYTSNATFKGLIIADVVDKIAGTPTIIGALVSLSSIDIQKLGTGDATILFSAEALNNATTAGFSKRICWYKE